VDARLREAFDALAERAPDFDATAAASGRTWIQAKREQHRARAGVAGAVVLILLAGAALTVLAGTGERTQPSKAPAYHPSTLAIPDRIWTPSPWTPGTDNAGPPGPLALLSYAPRHTSWFHTDQSALFGVSAATGTYRFLDLPDADQRDGSAATVALSPDGTSIGFWTLGHTSGRPGGNADTGFAVYDTVTGTVTTHSVPTRYGLDPSWMTWTADSSRLCLDYSQWDTEASDGGFASGGAAECWNPRTEATTTLGSAFGSLGQAPARDRQGLTRFVPSGESTSAGDTLDTVDPSTGRASQLTLSRPGMLGAMRSPNGSVLAYEDASTTRPAGDVVSTDGFDGAGAALLLVARAPDAPAAVWPASVLHLNSRMSQIVGWIDATHLLVEIHSPRINELYGPAQYVSVNVVSGQLTTVIHASADLSMTFATALLGHRFVQGKAPPSRFDPRIVPVAVGSVLLLALLVGGALLGRRLRVRRRLTRAQPGVGP
jgi:hypothetical protein